MLIDGVGQMTLGTERALPRHRPFASKAYAPPTGLLSTVRSSFRSIVQVREQLEASFEELSKFSPATQTSIPLARSSTDVGLDAGEDDDILSSVSEFASVSSGSLLVNDVSVSIDVSADSLQDVLTRIGSTVGSLAAAYLDQVDEVSINSSTLNQVELDSNGTGFFGAVNIGDGTYGSGGRREGSPRQPVLDELQAFVERANELFNDRDVLPSLRARLKGRLQSAVRRALVDEKGPTYSTGFGLRFAFGSRASSVIQFEEDDREAFDTALRTRGQAVKDVLLKSRSEEVDTSILGSFLTALKNDEQGIKDRYGAQGLLVDVAV